MPWVRFLRDYDYRVGRSLVTYPKGVCAFVKSDCAEKATQCGAAVKTVKPNSVTMLKNGQKIGVISDD